MPIKVLIIDDSAMIRKVFEQENPNDTEIYQFIIKGSACDKKTDKLIIG